MTQAAKRTTTRTRTGDSQPTLNGHGPHGDHDLVRDNDDNTTRDRRTERDSRDEQGTEGDEQDRRREQGLTDDRDDQGRRDARDEHGYGDRTEHGDGREPSGVQRSVEQLTDRARAATSRSGDAFAGTPDMSKVLTAWFDMAGNMMKLQQQFFTTVLNAANTNDRPTTKF